MPVLAAVLAVVAGGSVVSFPHPLVSGDMTFALVWGEQLLAGDLRSFLPGPTPHPLPIFFGAVVSTLGQDVAYASTQVIFGHLALGVMAAALFDLAWRLASLWAAFLTVALLVTSPPVLVWAAQAGYDLAFAACVLAAVALEVARPRRGLLPLVLLGASGLLRPEGWILAGAYWLWMAPAWSGGRRTLGAMIAVLAPAVWVAMDAAVMGDPLWSLHHTSEGSEALYQQFSVGENLNQAGRDFLSYVGPLGAVAALMGCGLARHRPWRSLAAPAAALLITAGLFVGLVLLGMASNMRYLLLPACLAILAGAAAATARPDGPRWRAALALIASALLVAQVVARSGEPSEVRERLLPRVDVVGDIDRLASRGDVGRLLLSCPRVAVPSVKLLGHWGHYSRRPPAAWISDARGSSSPDVYVSPRSPAAAEIFLTRGRFDTDAGFRRPGGMELFASSTHWDVHARPGSACVRGARRG